MKLILARWQKLLRENKFDQGPDFSVCDAVEEDDYESCRWDVARDWSYDAIDAHSADHENFPTPDTYTQVYHNPERFDFEDLSNREELWQALMQPKENKEEAKKLIKKGLWGDDSSLGSRLEAMDYKVETQFNEKGHLEILAEIGGFGFIAGQGSLPGVEMESMLQIEIKATNTDEERIEALETHESGFYNGKLLDGDFHLKMQSIPTGGQLKELLSGPGLLIQVLSREIIERDTVDFRNMRDRLNMSDLIQAKQSAAGVNAMNTHKRPMETPSELQQEFLSKEDLRDFIREVLYQEKLI